MAYKVIAIAGESGAGKDKFLSALIEKNPNDYFEVVSHTTRPRRDYETNGKEHWFDTQEKFNELKETQPMIAYTHITKNGNSGYEYAAFESDLDKDKINLYIIDPQGIENLLKNNKIEINLHVIYFYASYDTRFYRISKKRGQEELMKFIDRNEDEQEQFDSFRNKGLYDDVIINDASLEVDNFGILFKTFERMCDSFRSQFDIENMFE